MIASQRSPGRRVAVKFRLVRHRGTMARSALAAHIAYLGREGVSRDNHAAGLFSGGNDLPDQGAFAVRCADDRHHFRCIVSPEDANELQDLRAMTRDLMQHAEQDLGTRLDWIAVDHWNTDNPHVHILIRGKTDDGKDLVINRAYIGYGLRARAEALVEQELGPRTELAIRAALEREVAAERFTSLDRMLRTHATREGHIDLTRLTAQAKDNTRRLAIARLSKLQRMGLAMSSGDADWVLAGDLEQRLRDIGYRNDIIATMHKALANRSIDRGTDMLIHEPPAGVPVIGRLVERGLHDELNGTAYAVVDGIDGRAHHVRFPDLAATGDAPIGGIVELRTYTDRTGRPAEALAVRSDLALGAQIKAEGATWLDRQLLEREPSHVADAGFGQEVKEALSARAERLSSQGLARRQGTRLLFVRDLLAKLQQRELRSVTSKLETETGLSARPASVGGAVAGTFRRRIDLASGRFAMIEGSLGFQLVPWTPSLDRQLGREVGGIVRQGGRVEWSLGRQRGLEV
jgi:type IV secretory pathway VirD2 relaxase